MIKDEANPGAQAAVESRLSGNSWVLEDAGQV